MSPAEDHASHALEKRGKSKPYAINVNDHSTTPITVYGYTWVAVGSDMSMMVARAAEWLGELRRAPATTAPPAGPY